MSDYIITIHIKGQITDQDKEALETDLYNGTLDLNNYDALELPSCVDIMEDK